MPKSDSFYEYGPVYNAYHRRAKEKGLAFHLSRREFAELIKGGCFYCGRGPDKEQARIKANGRETLKCSGLDRVDNTLGYEPGNCVPCCTRCNRMKTNMTLEDFFQQVSRIYHFRMLEKDADRILRQLGQTP